MIIHVKRTQPNAVIPVRKSSMAAGFDLHACIPEAIRIMPSSRVLVSVGLAFEIPEGYEGQIRPRSGLALTTGVTVINSPGTIDADYRGEVLVCLVNLGHGVAGIHPGDRIAQIVFAPVFRPELVEVNDLTGTERGAGGFGSTGR